MSGHCDDSDHDDYDELKAQVAELERQLVETHEVATEDVKHLRAQLENKEAEVSALRERVGEQQGAYIRLTHQSDSLRAQLEAAKADAEAFRLTVVEYEGMMPLCGPCDIGENTPCICKEKLVPQRWLDEAIAERDRAQLTAQPSVLRDIAALPVDSDSSAKAVSLAKVALGLPLPTYKSVAEMEQAFTAQPDGVRELLDQAIQGKPLDLSVLLTDQEKAVMAARSLTETHGSTCGCQTCQRRDDLAVAYADSRGWDRPTLPAKGSPYAGKLMLSPAASTPPEGKVRKVRELQAWIQAAVPIVRVQAQQHPIWHDRDENEQDPMGAHRLLKQAKALATPAPAPRQVTHVCEACHSEAFNGGSYYGHTCEKAPAPAYDPKPDWRCKACEKTGMRHCSEPERCGNMKPPAPARCPSCGGPAEFCVTPCHRTPAAPAPACKTCGDTHFVAPWRPKGPGGVYGTVTPGPCPDCNAGEGEKI